MTPLQFADYSKVQAVNWSTLKELRRSPRHYRYRLDNERDDSPRLALGRAAHTAIFEPDRFMVEYACFKGERRAGKTWEAFKAAHESETILKLPEYQLCLAMRDAVRAHPVAARYLASGRAEQTVTWTDPKTQIPCKARLDWIADEAGAVVDLKTTDD